MRIAIICAACVLAWLALSPSGVEACEQRFSRATCILMVR